MTASLLQYCRHFFSLSAPPLSFAESWRAALGAFLGVSFTGLSLYLFHPAGSAWLLAPIGASTVILFVVPHALIAAPWPMLGSYLMSIASAWLCLLLIPYPPLAIAVAVALCIWLMARFKCVHPPGGAAALLLTISASHPDGAWWTLVLTLISNVLLMLLAAVIIHNLLLRRPYPYHPQEAHPPQPHPLNTPHRERVVLTLPDLDRAIRTLDAFVDIQEEEMLELYELAVDFALARQQGKPSP